MENFATSYLQDNNFEGEFCLELARRKRKKVVISPDNNLGHTKHLNARSSFISNFSNTTYSCPRSAADFFERALSMLLSGFSLRLVLCDSLLVTLAILTLIHADEYSEDLFSGDYSGMESSIDDMYYDSKQPDSLLPDLASDSSSMAMEFFESSSSDALGSSSWDLPSEVSAPDVFALQNSCKTQSGDLFGDLSPAEDGMLQARDNDAGICADPERDQTINQDTQFQTFQGQGIPSIFSPVDLTKQEFRLVPPDPPGSFIRTYGKCFLPYLIRCCCYGSYTWGGYSIWGYTLQEIERCSVGTYMSTRNSAGRFSVD